MQFAIRRLSVTENSTRS